jgi:uncharacterized membrane protein
MPSGVVPSVRSRVDAVSRAQWALVVILVAAAVLRLWALDATSLWYDELYSVVIRSQYPFWQLVLADDPHPPLYYLMLGSWLDVFDTSAVAARSLSAVFGVGAVAAGYVAGTELQDRTTGLVTAGCIAVAPVHVQFSQTARMYSLAMLCTTLSFATFATLYRADDQRRQYIRYIVTVTALVYTHVFGAIVLAGQTAYAIIEWTIDAYTGPTPWELGRLSMLIAGVIIPWGLATVLIVITIVTGQTGGTGYDVAWISVPTGETVLKTILMFGGALVNYPRHVVTSQLTVVTNATTGLLVALAARGVLGGEQRWNNPGPSIAVTWLCLPILLAIGASYLLFPVYSVRFLIIASGGLYVLAGMGVSALRPGWLGPVLATLVLVGLLVSTGVYYQTDTSEPWAEASAIVEESASPSAAVLAAPPFSETAVEYYFGDDRRVESVAATGEGARAATNGSASVWAVTRYQAPADGIVADLSPEYTVVQRRTVGELVVIRFERRANATPTTTASSR